MKKIFSLLFVLAIFFTALPAMAQEKINLYFFYGDGCPHCAKEEVFLGNLEQNNSNIAIYRYETWANRENAQLLGEIAKEINVAVSGVPFLIIGDRTVSGYYSDETTGKKITDIIENYKVYNCNDVVAPILQKETDDCEHGCKDNCSDNCRDDSGECTDECGCTTGSGEIKKIIPDTINLPILGEVKTETISLPLLTFVIAGTDGFNPCAMWVLLFLINLLLGMKDRKRMWILGSAFIISSGVVYFLFLSAWLNLFVFLGFVLWIRVLIAGVALARDRKSVV